jgi:hypothetical protein
MKKTNLAVELFLLACGLLPLGIVGAFDWLTKGKVPNVLGYGILAIFAAFVIAGIEERVENSRQRIQERDIESEDTSL